MHRALDRLSADGAGRADISAASLAVKRLLGAWGFGDVTAFTQTELRRSAESAAPRALSDALLNLAALDGLAYQPRADLGAAPLGRALRAAIDTLEEHRALASREAHG